MTELTAMLHKHSFAAMASPCEVQVECPDEALGRQIGLIGEREAKRIEHKFSRYSCTSVVAEINASHGQPVEVDEETAELLDYAAHLFGLSDGRFDITSGVLRRAWQFDGSDNVPSEETVGALLPLIGWDKVMWRAPFITLPPGMEIDLGGIGKEYAVDRAAQAIMEKSDYPVLVNFGGDLRVTRPKLGNLRWKVAIESVDADKAAGGLLQIGEGGLATSGDARRFLLKDGKRYSHILDPRTGFPVENPPRSITVAARTCMEAGTLATRAMLHGRGAEEFLAKQGVQSWVLW